MSSVTKWPYHFRVFIFSVSVCVDILASTGMLWSILPDTEEFTTPYIYQHQIRHIHVLKIILKWKLTKHKTYTGNHLTLIS